MSDTVEQVLMFFLYGLIAIFCLGILMTSIDRFDLNDLFVLSDVDAGRHFTLKERDFVYIKVKDTQLSKNCVFDPLDYVDLYYQDRIKNDLKKDMKVYGYVNTSIKGNYMITYVITHHDIVSRKEVCFEVKDESSI